MRTSYISLASVFLFLVLAKVATSQDAGILQAPIDAGDSLKITVVKGKSLSFEFEGDVDAVVDGVATIDKAQTTAVINRRWPYLCHLPIVGERFFTSIERRPQDSQEIRIELTK